MKMGDNIILMGPPGAGKTSCAKILAEKLGMDCIDIDDDHLEKVWNCSVAQKLSDVGDEKFVEEEGAALSKLSASNSVIALSGSNPLHPSSMDHVRTLGPIFFIDVPTEDILKRLEQMKVNRIVGQGTQPLSDILNYRKGFYEKNYDVRVSIPFNASIDVVAKLALDSIVKYRKMRESKEGVRDFVSTRGDPSDQSASRTFGQVILQGLSTDGGLFLPKEIPTLTLEEIERLSTLASPGSYPVIALRVLEKWCPELHPSLLKQFIDKAYDHPSRFEHKDVAPIKYLHNNQYILELFNGPTASFKDFALQLFPQIFNHYVKEINPNHKFVILVSTSGDTGSATVHGFCNQTDIPVIVLYPEEGVSPVQKFQMVTSTSPNLKVVGMHTDFDFCQTSIKKIFNDSEFSSHLHDNFSVKLSAANSINWGRLLPQVVYHTYTYLYLVNQKAIKLGEEIDICVPTGNFGNILAGLYAKLIGVPIRRLVCAANENDVLKDFIRTGIYDIRERSLIKTSSPSIDILKSSNLERLLYLLSPDHLKHKIKYYFEELDKNKFFQVDDELKNEIQKVFWTEHCSEENTKKTIQSTYEKTKTLLDPHTAVAKYAADKYAEEHPTTVDSKIVIYSTAHYAKFPTAVLESIGVEAEPTIYQQIQQLKRMNPEPPMHKEIEKACSSEVIHKTICNPDVESIKKEVTGFLSKRGH